MEFSNKDFGVFPGYNLLPSVYVLMWYTVLTNLMGSMR